MIIALNTSANVFAQQRNLKIYFNEYVDGGPSTPQMLVTDDNNQYGIPLGVTVSSNGVVWANNARLFEWIKPEVTDRLLADYIGNDKKESHLKLSFTSFPYEINTIKWNVMNDVLSGSITNFFDNYRVTTKCTPYKNGDSGFTYTKESWDMNLFNHQFTFNQMDIPWEEGATLNGLKSFEINETSWIKVGIGSWTFWGRQGELNDNCRTFIRAGWNGKKDNTNNITDSDDSNWAFKVTFTLPEIGVRSYTYDYRNKVVGTQQDNYIYVGEANAHALQGYISAHAGAVEPTYNPEDHSDFHFEYSTKNTESNFAISQYSGVITKATVAGEYPVVVKLMRADREVCQTEYTVRVSDKNITSNSPVICIGFADGKKGYDISVGDENAQIKGFIVKNANGITPTENTSGYHFEYSEASNGEIITINNLTGDITPKKEGDVQVTAVLKNGNTVISNPYTYTLHVFAQHEGLEFRRINTYKYTTSNNKDSWKISDNQTNSNSNYEWKPNNLLKVNASMSGVEDVGLNDWKQIAGYSVNSSNNWRAICQEIAFDIYVPKYTTATATYTMAGNAAIGNNNKGNCRYGFELFYVNQGNNNVSLEQATTWLRNRTWDTKTNGSSTNSSVTARWSTDSYHSSIGNYGYYKRSTDNASDAAPHRDQNRSYTVYFAAMAYLGKDHSYPGDVSFGFKAIPEYTYYTTVTYYMNDGTTNTLRSPEEYSTTKKDSTIMLFKNPTTAEKNMLKRDGYTFIGWSTDPNATTAEYEFQDDFLIYDNVNGGGKGPVTLYAVWQPNTYAVELRKASATATGGTEYVVATYTKPMPEGANIIAPTNFGYDFNGYYRTSTSGSERVYYYDKDMKSNHVWDRIVDSDCYVVAEWTAHKTRVLLDPRGGNNSGATEVTEVTATYGQPMPTEGLSAPTRTGYTFGGYYYEGNGLTYYNADMTSAKNWNIDERTLDPQQTEITLYARWIPNTYTVELKKASSTATGGTDYVTATYDAPMPEGDAITAPTNVGFDFNGYYRTSGSDTTYYYNKDMKSAHVWDRTENTYIVAKWTAHVTKVILDPRGGVNNGASVVYATYGQAMPTQGLSAPQRTGYVFEGYYYEGNGLKYYNADMTSAKNWYIDERTLNPQVTEITLYAKWTKVVFTVTLDADGGTLDFNEIGTWGTILERNPGSLVLQVKKGEAECSNIWCSNRINIKPGYKLLGWYTQRQQEGDAEQHPARHRGTLVYSVKPGNNFSYDFNAVAETSSPKYWNSDTKWVGTDDLTLYAHYEIIFEVDNDVITFLESSPKNCVSGEDLTAALDYAKNHGSKLINTLDMTNPDTGADGLQGEGIMEAFEAAKAEAGSIVSPNALVLFTDTWPNVRKTNAVTLNHDTGNGICQDLVVTDRYSMRIPVKFNAQKASYARDAGISDKETEQAQYSIWGTLCLPYPVKNKTNGVKYYWLQSTANDYMEFEEYADNAIIPANTPVLYKRTEGESSKINISENYVDIPKNISYTPVTINYADLSNLAEGTYPLTSADESIQNWEFRGNLKTSVFCGRGYVNPPADATIFATGEVYYFKQNKFTHLLSKRVIDGKTYAAGKMNLYPYRAYFYQKKGSGAKISAYSILVSDEDGTLDITDMVFGDGEGDGKIYDLNGIRVMQPVKGRLYIVNGKKKIYR
jgi:uncharacterized repeat protein (TIGR02543 family)